MAVSFRFKVSFRQTRFSRIRQETAASTFNYGRDIAVETFVRSDLAHRILRKLLYPLINAVGLSMDRFSRGRINFTVNYSCRARK
jgi:hypothetical protein